MSGSRGKEADKADLARRAIDYMLEHDFTLKWAFPEADPTPEEIKCLLASYFSDGESNWTWRGI